MTTNLHDKMLAAIDALFSASDAVEEEVAENLLLDVRDEIRKQKDVPETNFGNMNIYRSFEQWKNGNVLEHGVPRTEYYSEAQLDLVEMGWKYGYDAGRAVEQALDKKAENARELGLSWDELPDTHFGDVAFLKGAQWAEAKLKEKK
jgi:hypothetical protein